jgi:hypothetical protein
MSSGLSAMAVGSAAGRRSLRTFAIAATLTLMLLGVPRAARADWRPAGIRPTTATLGDVLAFHAKAVGEDPSGHDNRREGWTYTNGTHQLPVEVAVRGDDFRIDVMLDGAAYTAGRFGGARWRGDANGIVHGTQADLQSDAIDRFPDILFGFRPQDCELAGETASPHPAWVIADRPAGDRMHWLFFDQGSGLIVKSILREGKVVETTVFDRFDASFGIVRARHWHLSDGDRADDIDAILDGVSTGNVPVAAVAFPSTSAQRVFRLPDGNERVTLPAHFLRSGHIAVDVDVDGRSGRFILDTGTASITLNSGAAERLAGGVVLQHATVAKMSVGALSMDNVSVLAIPFGLGPAVSGILGYDFFFGHVVHIDYRGQRVEVLSHEAAQAAFADPAVTVIAANVDQGLPLVHAAIGLAAADDFALDTASPHFYVMQPFAQRYGAEIAAHWTRIPSPPQTIEYVEGAIEVVPYQAADLYFGPLHVRRVDVGVEVPTRRGDAIAIPFDAIIGTDILQHFELWFDYDNGRVAMRYTGA